MAAKEKAKKSTEIQQIDIIFTRANPNEIKTYENFFDQTFTFTELGEYLKQLKTWLCDKNILEIDKNGNPLQYKEIARMFLIKRYKKIDLTNIFAHIFSSPENVRLYFNSFPEELRNIILTTLQPQQLYVNIKELYNKFNSGKWIKKFTYWGDFSTYNIACSWLSVLDCWDRHQHNNDWIKNRFVYFNPYFFSCFYQAFCKEEPIIKKSLENEEDLKIFLAEKYMMEKFPIIKSIHEQHKFIVGKHGKLNLPQIKKYMNFLNMEEFFPSTTDNKLNYYRTTMTLSFLIYILDHNPQAHLTQSFDQFLHQYFDAIFLPEHLILLFLLPHLKGLPNNIEMNEDDLSYYFNNCNTALRRLYQKNCWIAVESLINEILCLPSGLNSLLLLDKYDLNICKIKNSKQNDEAVNATNYKKDLCEAGLKNWLFLMSSLGLLDIAYRDFNDKDRSWAEGLKYVRLTQLGIYVLGITPTYKPNFEIVKKKYFEINPDRLIVHSLTDDNPYESFLHEIGSFIGNHRYTVSFDSFLKNSNTKLDIENKIRFFKEYVCSDCSEIWENFFNTLLQRCQPLTEEKGTTYKVFKLHSEDKDLIQIICSDPEIKKWVIRAEHFIFLVKTKDLPVFSQRLKHFGFML